MTVTHIDVLVWVALTTLGFGIYDQLIKPFFKRCFYDIKLGIRTNKAAKQKREYRNGYGWAMAEVRLGNMKTYDLEMHIMSQFTEGTGKFEDGVERAIQDLDLLEFAETIEVPD